MLCDSRIDIITSTRPSLDTKTWSITLSVTRNFIPKIIDCTKNKHLYSILTCLGRIYCLWRPIDSLFSPEDGNICWHLATSPQ